MLNRLAIHSNGQFLCPLADDDLLDPDYFQVLEPFIEEYDVVYGWCRVEGSYWCPNRLYSEEALRARNYIPSTACIRKELLEQVGMWQVAPYGNKMAPYEDWHLWLRLLDAGARFKCVPEVVWTYRRHDGAYSGTGREEKYRVG